MLKIKEQIMRFINEEEGMEALQFVVIIVIAAALIPVLWGIKGTIQGNMETAQETADRQMQDIINDTGNVH